MMYGSRERSPRWLETMELLLKLGEEKSCLNQMDKEGNYSLHVAAWKKEQKAAELLLKYGADPALVNAEGEIVVQDAEGKFLLQKVTSFAATTTSTASEAAAAAVPPVPAVKKYQAYRG
jgi:ankyrin repeat protein